MLGGWLLYLRQLLRPGAAPPPAPCPVLSLTTVSPALATSRVLAPALLGGRMAGVALVRGDVLPAPVLRLRGCPC